MENKKHTEEEKKMGQKWVKEEHKASTSHVNTGFQLTQGNYITHDAECDKGTI